MPTSPESVPTDCDFLESAGRRDRVSDFDKICTHTDFLKIPPRDYASRFCQNLHTKLRIQILSVALDADESPGDQLSRLARCSRVLTLPNAVHPHAACGAPYRFPGVSPAAGSQLQYHGVLWCRDFSHRKEGSNERLEHGRTERR